MKGTRSKPDSRKADNKLSVKRKAAASDRGAGKKTTKKEKAVKDPNKPKRPASAFFVFMEEFRKSYKEKHPNNKSVSVVGKAGGDKWKSLSEAEKAPYVAKAEKRKNEYNKNMQAYNKKQAEGANAADDDVESDKSKSEVNDDDDEDDESGEEDEDDE
ncbi:HMG1/2-like protein [Macadamia integrifolia]|uniref:HMG1/2-like protein n=1 Tax=Macadamia integrifolia TaxID=60698 RepID=UPI001C4EE55B|nr:HMG1/2-like protein [Macadamia integrifolia]